MVRCCRCDSSHRRERRLKTQSVSSFTKATINSGLGTQQTWLNELDSTISASRCRRSNHTVKDSLEKREGGGCERQIGDVDSRQHNTDTSVGSYRFHQTLNNKLTRARECMYKWKTTFLTRHHLFDQGPWGQFWAVFNRTKATEFISEVVPMILRFGLVIVALKVTELEQLLRLQLTSI